MELFGPDDTWPEHPEPHFARPLDYAREAKWYLQKYDGHSWGKLICSDTLPYNNRCNITILRTAKSAESFALDLRSKVDRCPHRPSTRIQTALQLAAELVDQAERLTGAAERCMMAASKRARAEELLELAIARLDDAVLLEQAEDMEAEADVDIQTAEVAADEAGYSADAPVAAEPLLDEAVARLDTASHRIGRSAGSRRAKLRTRLERARRHIDSLLAQLR